MKLLDLPDPFVIAEIGGNHEGDFGRALALARAAAEAGAHAVKFQAYRPEGLVNVRLSPDRSAHFGRFALQPRDYETLAKECERLGVEFMASLWDEEFAEALGPFVKINKVGSGDLTNYPLVARLAATGKPLCVATAMATLEEVRALVRFVDEVAPDLRRDGKLCVMHCVATYGSPRDEYANLGAISTLRAALPEDVVVGYSDHTTGTVALELAVGMGARVIEAHFTDDPTREFRDHALSKTSEELKRFLGFCARRSRMIGHGRKEPVSDVETEARIREFRRGVYFSRDMTAGETASPENLVTLRPREGIEAAEYYSVLGRRLRRPKQRLEPLEWRDFE